MYLEQKCANTSRQCALSQHIEVAQSSAQRAVTSLTLIQSRRFNACSRPEKVVINLKGL